MNEIDLLLPDLYSRFKTTQQPARESTQGSRVLPLINWLTQEIRKGQVKKEEVQRRATNAELRSQISDIIRKQSGRYPLAEIAFRPSPPFRHIGFSYSFVRTIGEDTFTLAFATKGA